jgi:hypothetical protein
VSVAQAATDPAAKALKFTLISPFLSDSTRFLGSSFTPSPISLRSLLDPTIDPVRFRAVSDPQQAGNNRVPSAVLVIEIVGAAVALGLLALYLAIIARDVLSVVLRPRSSRCCF